MFADPPSTGQGVLRGFSVVLIGIGTGDKDLGRTEIKAAMVQRMEWH